jgi:hypothetical protein
VHDGADLGPAEQELRKQGFLKPGIEIDPEALRAFLAPLAEPSRVERFKFSREWLRGEATRVADPRSSNLGRQLNLPPSYVLIHRVSTAGMGVLCQLECEGPYRAEMLRWMPGYSDTGQQADEPSAGAVSPAPMSLAPHEPDTVSLATSEPNGVSPATSEPNGVSLATSEPDAVSLATSEPDAVSPTP